MNRTIITAVAVCSGAGLALAGASAEAAAQTPATYRACYVPSSGTVYRIGEPGIPQQCGSSTKKGVTTQHVEFTWTDGAGALFATSPAGGDLTGPLASPSVARLLGRALSSTPPTDGQVLTWNAAANEWQAKAPGGGGPATDHGSLIGLGDDDHTQYLLTGGVRVSANGFAAKGLVGQGTNPLPFPHGPVLMWYPGKSAFRAGFVNDNQWDDWNIGSYSVALGANVTASGEAALALGANSYASGLRSTAFAHGLAQGDYSMALSGHATGDHAVAIGQGTVASGDYSMVLGRNADSNDRLGAFVWGDASNANRVTAVSNNQFVVRAARFWLGNDNDVTATFGRFIETSTGAFLSTGGTWTNSSDAARKTGFEAVDGEAVLAKLAAMPVTTWSYLDEDASTRHMGPTAQDFSAAFGLGSTDRAIATVDADGVSLAAIRALIARTDRLHAENMRLRADNAELRSVLESLRGCDHCRN